MKKQISVVYNPLIYSLFAYSKENIRYEVINGIPYLISQKELKKARISLRAKIPIQYLLIGETICNFYELSKEKQELIKQKLQDRLTFTSQEIFMFFYILDLYLSNNCEIDLDNIHSTIRSQGKIDMENDRDIKTIFAYKKALKGLKHKILRVEIEKCNPRLYGTTNSMFTQQLLKVEDNTFSLGQLAELIKLSGLFSEDYMPVQIFNCRFNQIAKFILAYIFSYEIYNYKRNNPHIEFYEVKFSTLLKNLPYFYKNGANSNKNYYQHIEDVKSKTQTIRRIFNTCIDLLELYKEENIITSYEITPNIASISVKNFEKIKFCVILRG